MRKKFILFTMFLFVFIGNILAIDFRDDKGDIYYIVDKTNIMPGKTAAITFYYDAEEEEIFRGFQVQFVLPEGFTRGVVDGKVGKLGPELAAKCPAMELRAGFFYEHGEANPPTYIYMGSQMRTDNMPTGQGIELFTFYVECDESVNPGEYSFTTTHLELSDMKTGQSYHCYPKTFHLTVENNSLFPDCPEGEMRDAALYLYNLGIVQGENGLLIPNRDVTRAEVAKTSLYGVYKGVATTPATLPSDHYPCVYDDLQNDSAYYFRPARALLYLEYGDGVAPFDRNRLDFAPEDSIARVHVLKVLMETFNIQPDMDGTDNPFPNDANVEVLAQKDHRAMGYIRRAADLGIITKANDMFRPFAYCTRGEAFVMLYRIMKGVEAGTITDPNPQESDYFEPLNTTLKTIAQGVGINMGNFSHYTKTSFAIGGTVPLSFSHTYNSYNTTLPDVFFGYKTIDDFGYTYQPLGDGWSHNYHSFVTMVGSPSEGNARVLVHWGGGAIDVYKSDGANLVPESNGIYDTMELEGGEIVVRTKSQTEYRFSLQGGSGSSKLLLYLSSVKDRNDNLLTIDYEEGENGYKRISSVSDGNGRSLTFDYLSGTNLLSSVGDPLGRTVSFSYEPNRQTGRLQLSSFTDAMGKTTNYIYGDDSKVGTSKLLSRIQLPKGNYIENEYDANLRLSRTVSGINDVPTTQTSINVTTDYAGAASTYSQVDITRANGNSSYNYTFNANNSVTAMTGSGGVFINSSFDNPSHPLKPTAVQNNRTNVSDITYDERGNVLSMTVSGDGELMTTTMTYDEKNNVTSITDPMGNTAYYSYNTNGNLTGITAPEGVTTSVEVDSRGLPTEVSNPMAVRTVFEYDQYGNLTETALPALNLSSSATYDEASRLLTMTDALNHTYSFTYNENDLLVCQTDPDDHSTTYDYDANDNLESITNALGGVTSLSYDNATDWLTSVSFSGATKQYTHNNDGTLRTYTKPDGATLNYTYDELGRITSDGVNSYGYDSKLRLSSVSGNGKTVNLTYDGFNRVTKTTCEGNSNYYGYDKNGNRTRLNNVYYGYDGLNRLVSVEFYGNTITYTYRKDSQLSMVTYPNGMTTEYGYDAVGRLTSKNTQLRNGTVVAGYCYTLDKFGNVLEQEIMEPYPYNMNVNEETEYTYTAANRITGAGDVSFSFDANGNTKTRGNENYAWDKKNRLTSIGSTALTYNPLGQISSYGDIAFTSDVLGIGHVLGDSRSGAEYIYGNGLEARVVNGDVSYYVTDMRGSVVAIVDESGSITHKYQYDEFGNVLQSEEADYNPFQYVGKYGVMYLSDHLYYMRARHYDPTIGRFLSEDPIWNTNLYPYVENNPITGIDPKGLYLEYSKGSISGYVHDNGLGENIITLYRKDEIIGYVTLYANREIKRVNGEIDLEDKNIKKVIDCLTEAMMYKSDGKYIYDSNDERVKWPRMNSILSFGAYSALINNAKGKGKMEDGKIDQTYLYIPPVVDDTRCDGYFNQIYEYNPYVGQDGLMFGEPTCK
jgi:RHS repeat-associated protein